MLISFHPGIIGKPPKDTNINLGYGWVTEDVEWDDVFELITVDGYATSAALNSDHRTNANFVSRELIMVDIDSGMTIQELFEHDFYDAFGGGFYTTPSHTDENHRFRILFRLQTPIIDEHKLRKLNRGLLWVFDQADQACKDPARLFYGTKDCIIKEKWPLLLPDDVVEFLAQKIDEIDATAQQNYIEVDREYKPLTDERRKKILDLLKSTYVGSYPIWRNIGWGLKQGGFTLQDFQYVTAGLMNQKSPQDAANIWKAGKEGDVTMGTVMYILKLHHGPDCIKEEKSQFDILKAIRNDEWKIKQQIRRS